MTIWQVSAIAAIGLVSSFCASGCNECNDPVPVESGQYVILDQGLGVLEWLAGAQLVIDRDAETATLRYTREGTTYDVEFTLTHR